MTRPGTLSEQLAAFVTRSRYGDLPVAVRRDIRLRFTDALGLAISSSVEPFAQTVLRLARRWYQGGRCTGIGLTGGLSAPAAGLVNGTLVHGQDNDDTHTETLIHASSCIAPAAFALAEAYELNGLEMMTLAAAGYEVMIRVGLGTCPGATMHARGYHSTPIAGTIAAAAMAARAAGGGPEIVRHAIGISTGLAAGLRESVLDGTFAKAIQPGWGVQAGLWAAEAALDGITGPYQAFEGKRGLYQSHAGLELCHLERVTDGLGEQWEFLNTDYKLFPLCHYLQAPVEAASSIRAEAGIQTANEVASVMVEVSEPQVVAVCEPRALRNAPKDIYGLRFSLPYSVALGLASGAWGTADMARGLADRSIQSLAERVDYTVAPNPDFPARMPGSVRVMLADGRQYERRYESPPGRYGRPVEDREIEAKFSANAVPVLGPEAAEELLDLLRRLDDWPSMTPLSNRLAGAPISAASEPAAPGGQAR